MIVLETTFLVDYLDGVDRAGRFLDEHGDEPFFTATLALFEVYRGSARIGGRARTERLAEGLDWITPLSFTEGAAREAAVVEAELLEAGTPVNLGDVLIAGVCRHNGGQLVTRNDHFGQIADLETLTY